VALVRLISVVDALDSGVEPGSDLRGNAQGTTENREQKKGAESKEREGTKIRPKRKTRGKRKRKARRTMT
jgi:hypothetical protein